MKIQKISINDSIYPESLKTIKNPPKLLYVIGKTDLLNYKSIAIIGSRKASDEGKKIAQKFATELSCIGLTIISGLAKGIDSQAHIGAYNKKGKTIAVLPSGFNNIFPEENIDLAKKILINGGLLISEYPPETIEQSSNFLARNRIISGLSTGLLIVESAFRSGTSVTAKYAKSQNKPIFAIPHEISNPHRCRYK